MENIFVETFFNMLCYVKKITLQEIESLCSERGHKLFDAVNLKTNYCLKYYNIDWYRRKNEFIKK